MMKSSDKTLVAACRVLARDIQTDDGVANAALSEIADRLEELTTWRPIETARKDRTIYWAVLRTDLVEYTKRDDNDRWAGAQVPISHIGLADDGFDVGWNIAAPVGYGGFPDDWFAGVMELPPPPCTP